MWPLTDIQSFRLSDTTLMRNPALTNGFQLVIFSAKWISYQAFARRHSHNCSDEIWWYYKETSLKQVFIKGLLHFVCHIIAKSVWNTRDTHPLKHIFVINMWRTYFLPSWGGWKFWRLQTWHRTNSRIVNTGLCCCVLCSTHLII